MANNNIIDYWNRYCEFSGHRWDECSSPPVEEFGDNPELADNLSELILEGKKTASCGLLYEYEKDKVAIPRVGCQKIVLNGSGDPVCIIKVTEVEIKPYSKVDERFAHEEGEGDQSYESWDQLHREYFQRILRPEGLEFRDDLLLVCEKFEVTFT